jgi:uncharacterized protein YcaQ
MTVHQLSRAEARRIAVQAQLLDERQDDALDVVRHLTLLQDDLTATVAPNADLVLWSRIGSSYSRQELRDACDEQRLVDLEGYLRPAEDLALFRAEMAARDDDSPNLKDYQQERREWLTANNGCRRDILELLRTDGPLPASALPDTCVQPWASSGWNNNKNVAMMLAALIRRGEVAVAGREGRKRLYDLASRIYPDDPVVPLDEALRIRNERRLRALGLARARSTVCPGEPNDVGEVGEPAVVEGVPGKWRVEPSLLDRPFSGRTALLSPLDRLVFDRKRMLELFEFDYQLEMYKPAAKRRWGYFALPILSGDRLVGKLDATADHKEGELRVDAIHEDAPFSGAVADAVHAEIEDLARWLGLPVVLPG